MGNFSIIISSLIIFGLLLFAPVTFSEEPFQHSLTPQSGFVPNEETAKQIAVAIWEPIYGRNQILKQEPIHAKLIGEVWHVKGSLSEDSLGGVAIAEISKKDEKILRVSHGK